jgi:hypothetical protein
VTTDLETITFYRNDVYGDPQFFITQPHPEPGSNSWWEWVVVNPTDAQITVTAVKVKATDATDLKWTVGGDGSPATGWTDGGTAGFYWSGSQAIPAHSAFYFRDNPKVGQDFGGVTKELTWSVNVTGYTIPTKTSNVTNDQASSLGGMYYNLPNNETEQTETEATANGQYSLVETVSGGGNILPETEYVFYVNIHEWLANPIAAGGTLTITIPEDFTSVVLNDSTNFTDAAVSGGTASDWTIQGTNDNAISNDAIHLSFNATTPEGMADANFWEFDTRFTGTGDMSESLRYINELIVRIIGVAVTAPTNDQLSLTNADIGSQGVLSQKRVYTFEVKVTDIDGPTNIDYIDLTLDYGGQNLQFRWTESTDTFSEENDPSGYVSISSTSADSSSSGNQWTLIFKITFAWTYPDEDLNNGRLFSIDEESNTDDDTYSNLYYVENDLDVQTPTVSDYRHDPGDTLTVSGTIYYQGTSITPPDGDYQVQVRLDSVAGTQKGSTDTTLVSGAYSINDVTGESDIASHTYVVNCTYGEAAGEASAAVINDRIKVYYEQLNSSYVSINSYIEYRVKAVLEYDEHALGSADSLTANTGSMTWDAVNLWFDVSRTESSPGQYTFEVSSGSENTYGITTITTNQTHPQGTWLALNVTFKVQSGLENSSGTGSNDDPWWSNSGETVTYEVNVYWDNDTICTTGAVVNFLYNGTLGSEQRDDDYDGDIVFTLQYSHLKYDLEFFVVKANRTLDGDNEITGTIANHTRTVVWTDVAWDETLTLSGHDELDGSTYWADNSDNIQWSYTVNYTYGNKSVIASGVTVRRAENGSSVDADYTSGETFTNTDTRYEVNFTITAVPNGLTVPTTNQTYDIIWTGIEWDETLTLTGYDDLDGSTYWTDNSDNLQWAYSINYTYNHQAASGYVVGRSENGTEDDSDYTSGETFTNTDVRYEVNFTLNTAPHSLEATLTNQTYDIIWTGLEWDETLTFSGYDDLAASTYWADNSDNLQWTYSINYTYNHQTATGYVVGRSENGTEVDFGYTSGETFTNTDVRYEVNFTLNTAPHSLGATLANQTYDVIWTGIEWDETLTLSGYDDFSGGIYWADNSDNLQWTYAINYTYNHQAASGYTVGRSENGTEVDSSYTSGETFTNSDVRYEVNFTLNTAPHSLEATLSNQTYDVIWTGLEWDETLTLSGYDDLDVSTYWTDNSDNLQWTYTINYTYNHQTASGYVVGRSENGTEVDSGYTSGETFTNSDVRYEVNFTLNSAPHSLEATLANQTYDIIWTGLEWDETLTISGHDDLDSGTYWTDNTDNIQWTYAINYTYKFSGLTQSIIRTTIRLLQATLLVVLRTGQRSTAVIPRVRHLRIVMFVTR